MTSSAHQILAARFASPDGGSRAASAVGGAYPDKIKNAAVLYVKPDGTPKFVELRDWGTGRGALVGGLIGIIGGPLGMIAGGTIGALATKLRDVGFNDSQLAALGRSLSPNSSAVVLEIAPGAVDKARELLESLGAQEVVAEQLDQGVADLFTGEPAPTPEPDPAAAPATSRS